jgi:hypothetical protein
VGAPLTDPTRQRAEGPGSRVGYMVIWAYLVVERQNPGWSVTGDLNLSFGDQDGLADVLNAAGERGWELANAPAAPSSDAVYIFKRPVDVGEDASS